MPSFELQASDFKNMYGHLNGLHSLSLSRHKCIKFATTVGLTHLAPAHSRSAAAAALAAYRAMAVRSCLDFSATDVRLLTQYKRLETTEKANIAYWIGMTFSAAAADQLLNVPRLRHASKHHGIIKMNPASKRLADLVGKDASGKWHVIEAKARQTMGSVHDCGEWKKQASSIKSINTQSVATASYCCAILRSPLACSIVDPDPPSHDAVDLNIPAAEFAAWYYEPFASFVLSGSKIKRNGETIRARCAGIDPVTGDYVYLGLCDKYLKLDEKPEIQDMERYEDATCYLGADGVAVLTSSSPCEIQ